MLAACYLRSSKDRSDVSIDAQREKLNELAKSKGLEVVASFQDVVESGGDEDRPGFQDLATAIKNRKRGWTHLLILDTARLARNKFTAAWIKRDCERYGVTITFANMADIDPVTKILLESIFEGVDQWHSAISKQKALAGMRVNIRKGWRAGGRAPWGYQLQQESTGAMREGKPVMKSKLVMSPDADRARAFLIARAGGIPRVKAARDHGIELPPNSLIDVEWNALVYAGHTVWNRHQPKKLRGSGAPKRRPRAEWLIQRDTHPALISEAHAEAVLAQIESSNMGASVSAAKLANSVYLLGGMLFTSDGRPWVGAGKHYRLKPTATGLRGKRVDRREIEQAIISTLRGDLRDGSLIDDMITESRKQVTSHDRAAPVRAKMERLERQKQRAAVLALDPDTGSTFLVTIQDLTRQIEALRHEAVAIEKEDQAGEAVRQITPQFLREAIFSLDNDRTLLAALVQRVILDPDLKGRIEYGLSMASPRRNDRWAATPVSVTRYRIAG